MVNSIYSIVNFSPYCYNINFRSNNGEPSGLGFQPRLRTQPIMDIFEKSNSGGIVSHKKPAEKFQNLLPCGEIKQLCPSERENERKKAIEEEKKHIAKIITKRTEESKRKLRAAGVKEGDLNKYLTYDGHINSEGQRIINRR